MGRALPEINSGVLPGTQVVQITGAPGANHRWALERPSIIWATMAQFESMKRGIVARMSPVVSRARVLLQQWTARGLENEGSRGSAGSAIVSKASVGAFSC